MISLNKDKIIKKLTGLIKKPLKKIIYSTISSYPCYILYDFAQRLTGYKKERSLVCKSIGYYPNLKNPRSFNEKILWKKIYDRNPLLPIVADKYRVRQYLKEVLGDKEAEKILIPLHYVADKPESIPFEDLKGEYVVKPNHASGKIILAEVIDGQKRYKIIEGENKKSILTDSKDSRDEIIKVCQKWLSMPYGFQTHQWAYQPIKRKIVIEKLLRDNGGKIPADYRFTIFHGNCYAITVWYDRFIDLKMCRYTPEWEYISAKGGIKQADYVKKPKNLKAMKGFAKKLGKPFDFVRVDLYLVDNNIYFGELTNYSASGKIAFHPVSYDFELGSNWKITPKYWKLGQ
jgi:hypothetical protein